MTDWRGLYEDKCTEAARLQTELEKLQSAADGLVDAAGIAANYLSGAHLSRDADDLRHSARNVADLITPPLRTREEARPAETVPHHQTRGRSDRLCTRRAGP